MVRFGIIVFKHRVLELVECAEVPMLVYVDGSEMVQSHKKLLTEGTLSSGTEEILLGRSKR